MTARFLAAAMLATTALLPVAALAGSDYGSMPVIGMTTNTVATTATNTTNTTKATTVAITTGTTSSASAVAGNLNDTATSAGSDKKFYIEGRAGWSTLSENDGEDDAIPLGAAVGYRLSPNTRIEGEFAYRNYDYPSTDAALGNGSGDQTDMTAMLNAYYDFTNNSRLTPYVGAGIGVTRTSINMNYDDGTSTTTADDDTIYAGYNLMAGVGYAVSQNIDLTLGYRWLDALSDGEITATNSLAGDVTVEGGTQAHELLAGVRYNF